MCGIAGWVCFERDLTTRRPVIEAMTATMAARGPDDGGTWIAGPAALGHRRLAVLDPAGGRQPMTLTTPTGTLALVYTGEVYNYRDLRAELTALGHRFSTTCDTEVVLHAYQQWGRDLAERLIGMYAFAVYDTAASTLTLVRDRMGIKPLYYTPVPGGILFGSEPKAILAHPEARAVVGADGLRELFAFAKTPGQAVWDGMRELQPGHLLTLTPTGLTTHAYWSLSPRPHQDDRATTIASVRGLLEEIVAGQLVADVPRCLLLSGGLDSSTLTALAARALAEQGETVRSFAVDFAGRALPNPDGSAPVSDTPFAHAVAEHVGTRHTDITVDHTTLADPAVRRAVVAARDLPAGLGDMDASQYLLFRAIRERSTVALSGESADELFGGYPWFHLPHVAGADTFPWLAATRPPGAPDQLAELDGFGRPELMAVLDTPGYLADTYATAVGEVEYLPGERERERRMRRICYLHLTRFVRMLLDRKDRMSMAVGLEVRVPFCDHRLVEYVYNTPWSMKVFDGREKSLLRGAARDLLPPAVLTRAKFQYPSIPDPRYPAALQQQAKELLADRDSPVFDLVNRKWLEDAVAVDPAVATQPLRYGLERALDLATWLDIYRPELRLP